MGIFLMDWSARSFVPVSLLCSLTAQRRRSGLRSFQLLLFQFVSSQLAQKTPGTPGISFPQGKSAPLTASRFRQRCKARFLQVSKLVRSSLMALASSRDFGSLLYHSLQLHLLAPEPHHSFFGFPEYSFESCIELGRRNGRCWLSRLHDQIDELFAQTGRLLPVRNPAS